ncbi:MAG: succinate dehydrogenase cytochrome b subunit [Nitrospira sp.]|nr:succinate dehydrogenase cytochrome b subunit [Nitrospira sp.]
MRRSNQFQTSLSSKVAVALSGLGLAGFVSFHMLGNLQVFEGPDALNRYAAFLREMPIVLWSARLGLLTVAVAHIALAIRLALQNRRARPVAYAVREYRVASMASRTMALTGSLLLLFIVFHILHLTVGLGDPSVHDQLDERGHRDVYGKVIQAFHNPFYVALYCAGQLVLGMHLSHAVSGSLQTLGVEHAALIRLFRAAGPAVALFVVMGNLAIIFAVFLGLVRP